MAKPVKAIPDEYPGATPYLCVKGPRALATHKEDVSLAEMQRRAAILFGGGDAKGGA